MTSSNITLKRYHVASVIEEQRPRFSHSGLNRIKGKSRIPNPSPLPNPYSFKSVNSSVIVKLDLATIDTIEHFIPHLFTYKEYMEYALYDDQFGYYTTRPGIGSDFYTTPMKNSPHYGACMADLVFRQWRGMVEAGTFTDSERFDIVELGAGTGILARDFVQYVKTKSGMDPIWKIFHANLRYMTGEISPRLQTVQKETTSVFKDKVSVISADARNLADAFGKNGIQGLVLSNELPDAFPCHKILKAGNGKIFVAIAAPVIKEFDLFLNILLITEKSNLPENLITKINRMNDLLKDFLTKEYQLFPSTKYYCSIDEKDGFLTKQLYKELRRLTHHLVDKHVSWKEIWIPVEYIEEIQNMQKSHNDFFNMIPTNHPFPFNTDLRPFQEGCGRILKKGMQVHIDYMYDNADLIHWTYGFRTYPSTQIHDYTRQPGEEDITSDVNASALAVEGIRAHFKPFHFCTERELLNQLPDRYPHLKIRKEGLPFYVLTMLKEGTQTTYQSEVLTRPVTYRELFLKFSDWSCAAIPTMRYVKEKTALAASDILAVLYEAEKEKLNLSKIKLRSMQIIQRVESENPLLNTAIQSLLLRMVAMQPSFMDIARVHASVKDFEYKKIVPYFIVPTIPDEVDKVMIQLVHQVLQKFYAS